MRILILMSLLVSLQAIAQTISLTEESLIKMARDTNPGLSEVEASFLATKVQAMELEDKFGYELYSSYGHQNTKEKSTIAFQPVFGNINTYKVGVRKYTKYGVVIDLNTNSMVQNGSSDSGSDYKDLHTTKYELGFQVDLWKDLMGKLTKSQYDNLQDMKKKDELQQAISKNVFEVNIRRLYWSLVANAEKIRINQNLHKAAIVQLADAKKREANSISDKAAVAKFESLVHQRKGSILVLEYERESLLKNLRNSFPSLNGKKLALGKYNVNKSIYEVLACTAKIDKTVGVPYDNTSYDEVVSILKDMRARQLGSDIKFDDMNFSEKFDADWPITWLDGELTLPKIGKENPKIFSVQGNLNFINEGKKFDMIQDSFVIGNNEFSFLGQGESSKVKVHYQKSDDRSELLVTEQ